MFNERLKQKRDENNLTQVELARRVGIGRDLYNKYERTGARPSYETLLLLAAELNTTVDYLLGGIDTKQKNKGASAPILSYEEILLIESFRNISAEDRKAIVKQVTALAAQQTASSKQVSAG